MASLFLSKKDVLMKKNVIKFVKSFAMLLMSTRMNIHLIRTNLEFNNNLKRNFFEDGACD